MKAGAGRLNNRVIVKKPNENAIRDDSGKVNLKNDDNWRIVCHRWCQVIPRSGREFQRQQQIGEEITHFVRFRYDQESKKFKTTWKIEFDERQLNLAGPGIDEDDAHKFLLFPAIEQPVI